MNKIYPLFIFNLVSNMVSGKNDLKTLFIFHMLQLPNAALCLVLGAPVFSYHLLTIANEFSKILYISFLIIF